MADINNNLSVDGVFQRGDPNHAQALKVSVTDVASIEAPTTGKISSATLSLFESAATGTHQSLNNLSKPQQSVTLDSLITVDITLDTGFNEATLRQCLDLGLIHPVQMDYLLSAQVKLGDLAKIAEISSIRTICYSPYATSSGSVESGAEHALGSDFVNAKGYTGTGVTIGVLSDSYNSLGGASSGIASGDLPASGVHVLQDYGSATDEGRAMLEIIHDVAPDSPLMFASAYYGMAGFAQNIKALSSAGAKIIVDDIGYFNELTFTDDVIQQAIDDVAAEGKVYLTANGNDAMMGIIESNTVFRAMTHPNPWIENGEFLDFVPETSDSVDPISFTAYNTGFIYLRLTWSSPAPSVHGGLASSDLDMYITDSTGKVVGYSVNNQTTFGFDPIELAGMEVTAGETYTVWVDKYSGAPPQYVQINQFMGDVIFNNYGVDEYSSVYGHSLAAGAISVGAVNYRESPKSGENAEVEWFSSYGRAYLTHDRFGAALTSPTIRIGAEIAGVDGVNTTFFGMSDSEQDAYPWWNGPSDNDGNPNFFGTSAAAPSVAGVVALMLEKNPHLTNEQILSILQSTAYNAISYADESAFDPVSGAGLVNAKAAIAAVPMDTTAPTAIDFNPVVGAERVAMDSDIVFSFNERIKTGFGTIAIHSGSPTGSVVASFDVASNENISISENTLTINPAANLAGNTHHFVTFATGSILDSTGNSFVGTTYHFATTSAAPMLADSLESWEYLASHNDLINWLSTDNATAAWHYNNYGKTENRYISFDAWDYLASNSDLMNWLGKDIIKATEHYILYGRNESRSFAFDATSYLAANPDLAAWLGTDYDAAAKHYIEHGRFEIQQGDRPPLNSEAVAQFESNISESPENVTNVVGILTGLIYEVYAA